MQWVFHDNCFLFEAASIAPFIGGKSLTCDDQAVPTTLGTKCGRAPGSVEEWQEIQCSNAKMPEGGSTVR